MSQGRWGWEREIKNLKTLLTTFQGSRYLRIEGRVVNTLNLRNLQHFKVLRF